MPFTHELEETKNHSLNARCCNRNSTLGRQQYLDIKRRRHYSFCVKSNLSRTGLLALNRPLIRFQSVD